ncbi:MAG TPA: hypothetical protein VFO79_00435 [Xanthomonadales bacterium]|nr:hypothetical protein [Xanthomonadales bacterium]
MKLYTMTALVAATLLGAGCASQPTETLTHRETTVREQKDLSSGTITKTTTTRTVTEFVALDGDGDGYIVLDDLPEDNPLRTSWVEYDSDGDQRITRVEYDAWYVAGVDEE